MKKKEKNPKDEFIVKVGKGLLAVISLLGGFENLDLAKIHRNRPFYQKYARAF